MKLEQERGITIKAAAITFNWEGHKINLIDTPGTRAHALAPRLQHSDHRLNTHTRPTTHNDGRWVGLLC